MKRLQSLWMNSRKHRRDAEAVRLLFVQRYASMRPGNDGGRMNPKTAQFFASIVSASHARRAHLSRSKRAREARRDLPNPRTGTGAWSETRILHRSIPNLCRRTRRRVYCDLSPIYSEVLGLTTEVVLGPEDGLPRLCAVRCDFLTLMFKSKLTHFVSTLSTFKLAQLNRALAHALELPGR